MDVIESGGSLLLKELRRAAGLTQEQLAGLAGLHVRTIRGLETGHISRPRRQSLELLGRALGLDVSAHLRLLSSWGLPDLDPVAPDDAGPLNTDMSVIDLTLTGALSPCMPVTLSEVVTIDSHRRVSSRRTEEVLVALRAGVSTRHVFLEPEDDSVDLERMHLTDTENCQVLREFTDSERRIKVFELTLGHAIPVKGSHLLRYTADSAAAFIDASEAAEPPLSGQAIGGFFRPPSSYVLEVRFPDCDPPIACTQVFQTRPTGRPRNVAKLQLTTANTVHIALVNPRPGGHGIAWTWAE